MQHASLGLNGIEASEQAMDRRFEQIDRRFERIEQALFVIRPDLGTKPAASSAD